MYYVFAGMCLVLWMLGVRFDYTMGGFINLFPAIAVLLILLRVTGEPISDGAFIGIGRKHRIEYFSMPKTISLIVLLSGLILLMFGLTGVENLHSDASQFFNGKAPEKVFWMLMAGVVAVSVGIVTLITALRKEVQTNKKKGIHTGVS